MRAIVDEVRRVVRLTFSEEVRTAIRQGRSHPGWMADPHLRRGFFTAVPIFAVGAALSLAALGVAHSFALYLALAITTAILCNFVWFAIAARLRARESSRTR